MASPELVLQCLGSILGANAVGEQQLAQQSTLPNFLPVLSSHAVNPALDPGIRQLAAVILKQQIKVHWTRDSSNFEPPVASDVEKAHVARTLPAGLSDTESKVRTAVGMCIAAIYKLEPESWPGLLENLVAVVKAGSDVLLVHGAIRCLSLMTRDVDEQQLPQLAQALLPELHRLTMMMTPAGQQQHQEGLRAQAIQILHNIMKFLELLAGQQQRQLRDLLCPLVEPWVEPMCAAVAQPLSVEDLAGWRVRMQCLRVLTLLVAFFGKPLAHHMPAVLQACWRMYTASLQLYQELFVHSERGELLVEVDSDGDTLDLETLLAQLFELLIALSSLPRYAKQVRQAMPEMTYLAIGYMQMTSGQASSWEDDPNQYVADEEDSAFTARVSGELLVDTLVQAFGLDALCCVLDAVERRMQEAAAAAEAGQAAGQAAASWWKLREAALLALGTCGNHVEELLQGGGRAGAAARVALRGRVQRLVDDVLQRDLQAASCNALLVGRALWVAARLHFLLRDDQRPALLAAAAAGLNSELPAPVKIGACRALACLLPRVPAASRPAALLDSMYGGVVRLLCTSSEDALNLVLESMVPLIKVDAAAAARNLHLTAGPVLQAWSGAMSDPLLADASQEVVAALAAVPECLLPLAQQALPPLAAAIQQQQAEVLEGCMDMLGVLVRSRQRDVVQAAAASTFFPLLQVTAHSDDSGVVQGATQLLCELVRAGGPDLLSWAAAATPHSSSGGGAGEQLASPGASAGGSAASPAAAAVFQALLCALQRLLDPAMDEHRSLFAANLLYQTLLSLPAHLEPFVGQLLGLTAAKLVASNMSYLVGGLLAVLGLLVCRGGAGPVLDALAAMQLVPPSGGPPVNGLAAVLPIWAERVGDMQGSFKTKQAAMALALVLRSGHPLALSTMVRGKRCDAAAGGGVRTRRQVAAGGGEQWTQVPLAVKLAAVLSEMMVEAPWDDVDGGEGLLGSLLGDMGAEGYEDIDDDDDDEYDEKDDEQDFEDAPAAEDGGQLGGGQAAAGGGLSIAGMGISNGTHAALDAGLAHSPSVHAEPDGPDGGDDQQHAHDPLFTLDLKSYLAGCFAQLQAQQPQLLAAAAELLPPKKLKKVADFMSQQQQ